MRIDEAADLTEATVTAGQATEQRLSGLGVSPGIAIGPAYRVEGGDLQVHESHIPETEIEAERARFGEAVAASLKQLRKLKAKTSALPGIRRRGDRLSARRASRDAVELAPGARRGRAHRQAAHQCRARGRARDRRDRQQLRRDARPLSRGPRRGHPGRRHAADPQPDQEALCRLFGRARGRGHPRRRADPGRHRADGPAAHRRLCDAVRRRRQPHRDRRARARPAGGAWRCPI